MNIAERLATASEPTISYEIIPPKRGGTLKDIFEVVAALEPFDPAFIDVTSHSAEVTYDPQPDGTWKRRVVRKRPGTLGLCAAIQSRFGIPAVPHLLCEGFTNQETEDALIELNYLGVNNVMALRGDASDRTKPRDPDRACNDYAADLVRQITAMNQGEYLEDLLDAAPTDFCVGVAGYPEKHFEAPSKGYDIAHLKAKVDAGAHYVTTQMFFDNQHYFDFAQACREAGIDVPILPGLKILTRKRQLRMIPSRFFLEMPEPLVDQILAAEGEDVTEIGVRWAIQQSRELLEGGAPGLHFYIMQRADVVSQVVSQLR
jgi:methylenetetrahydrofolate reductase (NADPH)